MALNIKHAEVVNAPEPRLKEVTGTGEAVITELKLIRAAAVKILKAEIFERRALSSWNEVLDYLKAAQGFVHDPFSQ